MLTVAVPMAGYEYIRSIQTERDAVKRRCPGTGPASKTGSLARNIELSPQQLREILFFIYDDEDYEGVKWTPEVLFTYVPRTFETAVVSKPSARMALEQVLNRRVACPGKHT